MSYPSTFSKSRAGPFDFTVRSAISVISNSQLTGAVMRLRSPLLSRKAMKSRRSLYFMVIHALAASFML